MTKNYARNINTGELRFFDTWSPALLPIEGLDNWAFFEVPSGANASRFRGRLIGESSDVRCERLSHQPLDKRCPLCAEHTAFGEN
jgi:hypothetical protein